MLGWDGSHFQSRGTRSGLPGTGTSRDQSLFSMSPGVAMGSLSWLLSPHLYSELRDDQVPYALQWLLSYGFLCPSCTCLSSSPHPAEGVARILTPHSIVCTGGCMGVALCRKRPYPHPCQPTFLLSDDKLQSLTSLLAFPLAS